MATKLKDPTPQSMWPNIQLVTMALGSGESKGLEQITCWSNPWSRVEDVQGSSTEASGWKIHRNPKQDVGCEALLSFASTPA